MEKGTGLAGWGVEGVGDRSQIESQEANLGTRGRGKPGPSNLRLLPPLFS